MVFARNNKPPKPTDTLVNLVLAMREDSHLQATVQKIIQLGEGRVVFLGDLINTLKQKNAPVALVQSLALLADNNLCEQLKQILREEN